MIRLSNEYIINEDYIVFVEKRDIKGLEGKATVFELGLILSNMTEELTLTFKTAKQRNNVFELLSSLITDKYELITD